MTAAALPRTASGAWLGVAILSMMAFLIIGGTLTSLSVYLPAMQAAFGWQPDETGAAAVTLLVAMSAASMTVGWALDRTGARAVLAAGIMAVGAGWIGASQISSFGGLVAAMAVTGLGIGTATIVPGIAIITRLHDAHRGVALALFIGACALASGLVPSVVGRLILDFGWRRAFAISGSGILALCLALICFLHVPQAESVKPGATDTIGIYRDMLRTRAVWILSAALVLAQLSMNGVLFGLISCLTEQGIPRSSAIDIYSTANLLGLPSLLVAGFLSDRCGARWVLIGAMAMQSLGTLTLLGVMRGDGELIWPVWAFVLLWGLAGGLPAQAGPMVLTELIDPRLFTAALGFSSALAQLIGATAPILTDWLHKGHGGYAWPIAGYAMMAAFAIPLVQLAGRMVRRT